MCVIRQIVLYISVVFVVKNIGFLVQSQFGELIRVAPTLVTKTRYRSNFRHSGLGSRRSGLHKPKHSSR